MGLCHLLRDVVLLAPLLAGGCLHTSYQPLHAPGAEKADAASPLERRVTYRLSDAFYRTAPRCAVIVTVTKAPGPVSTLLEKAVERHLAMRLPRVIGGAQGRRAERELAVDLTAQAGRRVFGRRSRCDAAVEIHLTRIDDDYMVLWAQRRLTAGLVMRRISDGRILWQAQHTAGRGDGGLPFTLIDLPISVARAGMVTQDAEMFASIADDAARRMMKTLPDLRSMDDGVWPTGTTTRRVSPPWAGY